MYYPLHHILKSKFHYTWYHFDIKMYIRDILLNMLMELVMLENLSSILKMILLNRLLCYMRYIIDGDSSMHACRIIYLFLSPLSHELSHLLSGIFLASLHLSMNNGGLFYLFILWKISIILIF
jgi:hypothetical protein